MSDGTKIEWTDATWNPITGCSLMSPGCTNCYAMTLAGTRLKNHPSREGLTQESKAGPVWTGEVRFNAQWLDQPLRWQRSRMIFVCAHGDLFHDAVPVYEIAQVFAVMAVAQQHIYQVLTKRAERMREVLVSKQFWEEVYAFADERAFDYSDPYARRTDDYRAIAFDVDPDDPQPLPNVWLGVSCEDQQRFDERWRHLRHTPAAVTFISFEPLLGDIFFRPAKPDWVIVGGESGKAARPMNPKWARSLRDQCAAANVPFFFKQWGEYLPASQIPIGEIPNGAFIVKPRDSEGLVRVGKKAAGRLLDGIEHNAMPHPHP